MSWRVGKLPVEIVTLREKLHLALVIVFAALTIVNVPFIWERWYSPRCTTDIVESQKELAESRKNLADSPQRTGAPSCIAYRHHIDALMRVATVTARCGPPQMMPYSTWPIPEAEEALYRHLV